MKVFISYATEDLPAANTVFREMDGAGAEVFQFGRTEIFGKPSWEQVLEWITRSDVFIVLISRHALRSKPVREEIEQAHYSYINRGKPEKLVPAIIEAGAAPPTLIERFTQIDFADIEAGLDRLIKQLKLVRKVKPAAAVAGLPDFASLFAEFKRRHPAPLPANQFSAQADKVLSNYNKVAPKAIGASDRKQHVDGILAGISGRTVDVKRLSRYDAMFLGLDPEIKPDDENASLTTPRLASTLASFNLSDWKLPLDTPVAAVDPDRTIAWPPVKGAMSYEVKCDPETPSAADTIVYRGTEARYRPPMLATRKYRVRAIGGVFRSDSAWSEPVLVGVLGSLSAHWGNYFAPLAGPVNAPVLEVDGKNPFTHTLRWSYPGLVEKYVLECALTPLFLSPQTVYEGTAKAWESAFNFVTLQCFYRVKGVVLFGRETPWSNVVEYQSTLPPAERK